MIDLHCHILPGIDDGASDLSVSVDMARIAASDGISVVACTPHIVPGLYDNAGPAIRLAVHELSTVLADGAGAIALLGRACPPLAYDTG